MISGNSPRPHLNTRCGRNGRADFVAQAKASGAAYRVAFGAHYPHWVVEVSSSTETDVIDEIEATAVVDDYTAYDSLADIRQLGGEPDSRHNVLHQIVEQDGCSAR